MPLKARGVAPCPLLMIELRSEASPTAFKRLAL